MPSEGLLFWMDELKLCSETGLRISKCVCLQLATKKGGLGAQKVSSQSFSELEKKAQAADKLREKQESSYAAKTKVTSEESTWEHFLFQSPCVSFFFFFCPDPFMLFSLSAPSLRLAYKELEQQKKIEEQKLKGLEGKKKEQAERLGMGLGMRR